MTFKLFACRLNTLQVFFLKKSENSIKQKLKLEMKTKRLLLGLLAIGLLMSLSIDSFTQTVLMGEKLIKTRGASEYVLPAEDVEMLKPVLSRGGCMVKIDNWTGYYIDLWVDKIYKGRLNPWASNQMILDGDWTEVYARTMGEAYQWSSEGECNEEFVLKLEAY
jgi:hypothetical protein